MEDLKQVLMVVMLNLKVIKFKKLPLAYNASISEGIVPYTNDEALAFFLDNNLTKQQYINIRLSARKKKFIFTPSYEYIL